jgi:hypothetical protein
VARRKGAAEPDAIAEELRQIKMLLVAGLLRDGVKQGDLAALIGVSDATMSRMMPKGARSLRPKGTS